MSSAGSSRAVKTATGAALYTFWRRSSPYPGLALFDAPSRETCVARRLRSDSPAGALVTLNDPVFVEAAAALGQRMEREGGATAEERLRYGWKLLLVSEPSARSLRSSASCWRRPARIARSPARS